MEVHIATALAVQALTYVVPYLKGMGDAVAKKSGEQIFEWMKTRLGGTSDHKPELEKLQTEPGDRAVQAEVEKRLTGFLTSTPNAVSELQALLNRVSATEQTIQINQSGGERSKLIGQVIGNVSFTEE